MMVSLFSVFDPVGIFMVSVNWWVFFLPLAVVSCFFYVEKGLKIRVMSLVFEVVGKMLLGVASMNYGGVVSVGLVLFVFVVFINVVGLFPFVFTGTSHLVTSFSLGFVLWYSFFLMGWIQGFSLSSGHLVPEGSPVFLSPFMSVIEGISHLIRPVTLSVRLAANMIAGHLIVGMIALFSEIGMGGFVVSVFLQTVLLILEWAVCFIQAFVFSVLIILYSLEYY